VLPHQTREKPAVTQSALHIANEIGPASVTENQIRRSDTIQYILNQWENLTRYTLDGLLTSDNNRAERAIKLSVIGRKNWLFSQTAIGANANDLNVFEYVMTCLDELSHPDVDIEQLLPWQLAKR
jgi:transposase